MLKCHLAANIGTSNMEIVALCDGRNAHCLCMPEAKKPPRSQVQACSVDAIPVV